MIIMLLMLVSVQPYENREDDLVALVSFLSLASIAHMASVFRDGEDISGVYYIITVCLVLLPVACLAYFEITKRQRFKQAAEVSRGAAKQARFNSISDVKRSKLFARLSRPQNYRHHVETDPEIKSFLGDSKSGPDEDVINSLADAMQDVHRAKGDLIIEKAELPKDPEQIFLYLIVSGTVEILRSVEHYNKDEQFAGVVSVMRGPIDLSTIDNDKDNAQQSNLIAEAGAGDVIGEATFVSGEPRSAYVRASSNVHLLRLSRAKLDAVRQQHSIPATPTVDSGGGSSTQLRPHLPSRPPRAVSQQEPRTPQKQRTPSAIPGAAPYSPVPNNSEAVLPPLRVTPTKAKIAAKSKPELGAASRRPPRQHPLSTTPPPLPKQTGGQSVASKRINEYSRTNK